MVNNVSVQGTPLLTAYRAIQKGRWCWKSLSLAEHCAPQVYSWGFCGQQREVKGCAHLPTWGRSWGEQHSSRDQNWKADSLARSPCFTSEGSVCNFSQSNTIMKCNISSVTSLCWYNFCQESVLKSLSIQVRWVILSKLWKQIHQTSRIFHQKGTNYIMNWRNGLIFLVILYLCAWHISGMLHLLD